MKARVKDTGEIVTLRNLYDDGTARDINGRYYHQGDISEFIEDSNRSVDWEQRRYEIAKEAMNSILTAPIIDGVNPNPSAEDVATYSVRLADALIEELKDGER